GFVPAPPAGSEPAPRRGGQAQGSPFDFGGPLDAEVPPSRGGPEPRDKGFDSWGPAGADVPPRRGREDAGASPQGAEHDHALPSDPWNRSAPEEAPRRPPGPDGTPPAPAAPAHAWPEAAGASMSGMTSSWPEAEPRREPGPPRADEPWPPRAAGTRPVLPQPADSPPREATRRSAEPAPLREDEAWSPRPEGTRPARPRPTETAPSRETTAHPEPWPPREGAGHPAEPAPSRQARPRADEAWPPRPEGTRPVLPRPADDSAPPRAAEAAPRADTGRAVFERMAEHAVRPAGLGRRFTARVLDSLVYAAAAYAAARPLIPGATVHLQAKVDAARASGRPTTVWLLDATITGQLALVLGAVLLFGILYEVLPTARWGRTAGKRLLGVRVLATATLRPPRFGAALRRWLVYAFLGLPGSLACLANRPRRQAWHDKAAKTYVSR
ncbi:RDD family protein, partial [Streptomyces sp. NPDC059072]|uniref:RDD family protein n=1 Tax=Streptomyces sp. NPDC059072 TaxID=3346715 RepID=UPI00369E41F4